MYEKNKINKNLSKDFDTFEILYYWVLIEKKLENRPETVSESPPSYIELKE